LSGSLVASGWVIQWPGKTIGHSDAAGVYFLKLRGRDSQKP
jgi:hypothetical protein